MFGSGRSFPHTEDPIGWLEECQRDTSVFYLRLMSKAPPYEQHTVTYKHYTKQLLFSGSFPQTYQEAIKNRCSRYLTAPIGEPETDLPNRMNAASQTEGKHAPSLVCSLSVKLKSPPTPITFVRLCS